MDRLSKIENLIVISFPLEVVFCTKNPETSRFSASFRQTHFGDENSRKVDRTKRPQH